MNDFRLTEFDHADSNMQYITRLTKQFHLAVDDSRVITRQTGTFRSNCIDCLDRTNVVQSMLSWCALEQALITIGRLSEASASLSASASRSSALADMWPGFGSKFRSLWAENADYCSLQYAGTRALKTDFTRTGMWIICCCLKFDDER
ncbi:hypothetical protein AHF37_00730 [Paragonimus kellicotti]|nr:hypothetical protein AHF37_00730 [Paragonimus kellicotti]